MSECACEDRSRKDIQDIFKDAPLAWAQAVNRRRVRAGLDPVETRHCQPNTAGSKRQQAETLKILLERKIELLRAEHKALLED